MLLASRTVIRSFALFSTLAVAAAGCGAYTPTPIVPQALSPESDSGFAIVVDENVRSVTIDTRGRFVREYEPTILERVFFARQPAPTDRVLLAVGTHAWSGWRVVVATAPPGTYRLAALTGCSDDPYRSKDLEGGAFAVEPHRITLVGSASCVEGHALFDTFPDAKHRAASLVAAEDAAAGERDRLWWTWARATQLE